MGRFYVVVGVVIGGMVVLMLLCVVLLVMIAVKSGCLPVLIYLVLISFATPTSIFLTTVRLPGRWARQREPSPMNSQVAMTSQEVLRVHAKVWIHHQPHRPQSFRGGLVGSRPRPLGT